VLSTWGEISWRLMIWNETQSSQNNKGFAEGSVPRTDRRHSSHVLQSKLRAGRRPMSSLMKSSMLYFLLEMNYLLKKAMAVKPQ
jgi:hypothetical protein